ncbi:hypothetical protein C0991_006028 [Blastosporella zonata]|nr:hypothetical protein C0991_006028 [Blastosporella zonata]
MVKVYRFSFSAIALFSFVPIPTLAAVTAQSKHSRTHSLGDNYNFDPRDGWQIMEATDLSYKYHNSSSASSHLAQKRGSDSDWGIGDSIKGALSHVWNGMKAFGDPDPVTITWYTGHDLENPSCWANGDWAPTDKSFACATTLHGWHDRPQCFDFLQLCNGPYKCVFVRVVDSCAGCKPGSHHIDLTRAAFRKLASEDKGKMTVQLRKATPPDHDEWREDLWGPRHHSE